MKQHTLYKAGSFILMPVAAIFGLFCLPLLFVAIGNPPLLLPLFLIVCVVIYIITSFIFLNKAIMNGKKCKPGLKDWIKVNAYVSMIFAAMMIFQGVGILSQPQLMSQMIDQALAAQPSHPKITKELMLNVLKGMMYALVVISAVLMVHIFATFRLLKLYRQAFETSADDQQ